MVLAYIFMILGLIVFVLQGDLHTRIVKGFLFGMIVCGVYNATFSAIFDRWKIDVFAMDVAWGSTVYAISAAVA